MWDESHLKLLLEAILDEDQIGFFDETTFNAFALHKLESLKFLLKAKKILFRCQYNDESSLLQISLPRFFQVNEKVDVHVFRP